WARHDAIGLMTSTEDEEAAAHIAKTLLAVEGDGARVVLPDREVEGARAAFAGCSNGLGHQRLRQPLPTPTPIDIEPKQLDGIPLPHACRWRSRTDLRVTGEHAGVFHDQRVARRIGQLTLLLARAEGGGAIGVHVFGAVVGPEGVAKRALG